MYLIDKILKLCKELSTKDEVLSFRGFLNGFNGQNSRVILYNSKLDLEWDTKYKNFASRKTKTPKLTESLALEVVKRKCIKLSLILREYLTFKYKYIIGDD